MSYGHISSKWPALFVKGPKLTEAQANEVIVRLTDPYWLIGNDREWGRLTHEAFGIACDDRYGLDNYQAYDRECRRVYRELGTVHTEYLGLAGRVYSAMIGGSYGWCNWDGTIAGAYNVGKWPSVEELTAQWTDVARAFPFLTLTAQAFDCEVIEMDGREELVAEWTVAGGVAVLDDTPGPRLDVSGSDRDDRSLWEEWFTSGMRERHVSLDRLQEAIAQVRRTYVPEDDGDHEHDE